MIINNIINKYNIIKWSNKLLFKTFIIWVFRVSSKGDPINNYLQLGFFWSKADNIWLLLCVFWLCKYILFKVDDSVKLNDLN